MMTMARSLATILLLALLTLLPEPALAQRGQTGAPESREQLERRVRERFESLIRKELSIDEATSTRLRMMAEQFAPERRQLARQRGELRRAMRSLDDLLPAAEAQAILDDLVEVQRAELEMLVRERAALLAFLSPGQVLRFYALRDQFGDRVRDVRDRPTGRGPGGGGAPRGSRRCFLPTTGRSWGRGVSRCIWTRGHAPRNWCRPCASGATPLTGCPSPPPSP